jgi:hypothetical protein
MLPSNILTTIELDPLCTFEIQYQVNSEIFVWAATVNTADFSVASRGVKFLNIFPKCLQNQSAMSSIAEVMLHCQDVLPLQTHSPISYESFQEVFRNSPFLNYILCQNENLTESATSK